MVPSCSMGMISDWTLPKNCLDTAMTSASTSSPTRLASIESILACLSLMRGFSACQVSFLWPRLNLVSAAETQLMLMPRMSCAKFRWLM